MKIEYKTKVKVAGVLIELEDKQYICPPLNLKSLELLQERLSKFQGVASFEAVQLAADCVFHALSRNYPDISQEEISEKIDLGNFAELMEAVMGVSKLAKQREVVDLGEDQGATS